MLSRTVSLSLPGRPGRVGVGVVVENRLSVAVRSPQPSWSRCCCLERFICRCQVAPAELESLLLSRTVYLSLSGRPGRVGVVVVV